MNSFKEFLYKLIVKRIFEENFKQDVAKLGFDPLEREAWRKMVKRQGFVYDKKQQIYVRSLE